MFKIGQFANLCQVSIKTLRYYESIGILVPIEIDKFTGYRHYSANQIQRLNKILAFKDLGFTLNEIADLLNENINTDQVKAMLTLKKSNLKAVIRDANSKLGKIKNLIELFDEESLLMYDVSIKKIKPFIVASCREIKSNHADQGDMWHKLNTHIEEYGAKVLAGCFASYHDYSNNSVDIEIFEPIDRYIPSTENIVIRDMPAVTVASVIHRGPFRKIKNAYSFISEWIDQNEYEIIGLCREIYLAGEWNCKSENEYVSELQIPVRSKN